VGPNVLDLRGMFLRGTGGNAGPLGQSQVDTMRPITGNMLQIYNRSESSGSGAFRKSNQRPAAMPGGSAVGPWADWTFNSGNLGTHFSGTETRPVNMAVRYLIRALN